MTSDKILQQFNQNPFKQNLDHSKEVGLLVGLMSGIQNNFYVDSLETGVDKQHLEQLLIEHPRIKSSVSIEEMLRFLNDEGDRTPYSILLPCMLSFENTAEVEATIRKRFFGIGLFINKYHYLQEFIQLTKEEDNISINRNDIERGILAWDMGRLVYYSRIAYETDIIDEITAWNYIESAAKHCQTIFNTWEEVGKSFLIGQAMEYPQQENLRKAINNFKQAIESKESPWKVCKLK